MPNGPTPPEGFRLSISTPSRHPANQDAYDALAHRYAPGYVRPESWILNLGALAVPPAFGDRVDGVTFVVEGVGFSFQTAHKVSTKMGGDEGKGKEPLWRTRVSVPRPGSYRVTLRGDLKSGQSPEVVRQFSFRDLLIVSIGDSFSSGQGNPDLDAIPKQEDIPICKATTFTMFVRELKAAVAGFLKNNLKAALEHLPFLGKNLTAALGGVVDATALFKDMIVREIRVLTDGVRTVVGFATEAGEAFLGLFGIGDGAEGTDDDPRPAKWQEPLAYRSYRSGWSLAARLLETDRRNVSQRVTFLSFARSGSEIQAGLLGPRTATIEGKQVSLDRWIGDMGQVEEAQRAVGDRRIDVLFVSIGGNDLGFAGTLTDLIRKDSWLLTLGEGDDSAARKRILADGLAKLSGSLSSDFETLHESVRTRLNPRHVLISEYPTGLFTRTNEEGRVVDDRGCGLFSSKLDLDVVKQDGELIRTLGNELNTLIRQKAKGFGWTVVGAIKNAFDGHGYCAGDTYFVGAEESCLRQGDFEGTMHPNAKGQEVVRDCAVRAVRQLETDEWPVIASHLMLSG